MNKRQKPSVLAATLPISMALILVALSDLFLASFFPAATANQINSSPDALEHESNPGLRTPRASLSKELTIEDRLSYQYAIEEVYWRHRIWPGSGRENSRTKPPLDQVISAAQVREKVNSYLRDSEGLATYGSKPITPAQLQDEMDRMAYQTRQPNVLDDLFSALNRDPLLIAECLVRPILAKRLLRDLEAAAGNDPAVVNSSTERSARFNENKAIVDYRLPDITALSGSCVDDTWTATSTATAPSMRADATAIWTGTEMIVWGGFVDGNVLNTGGRYSPSTDSWLPTTQVGAPIGRASPTSVWTGTEMIVWGGLHNGTTAGTNTGGRYNPATDSWVPTTATNAPPARYEHTAIWTGNEMIVWGGQGSGVYFNAGGRYNPSTDVWVATSTANAPVGRYFHSAVWTGSEMIVWGGQAPSLFSQVNNGGRYNPSTNSWVPTTTNNAPTIRQRHTAVWSGNEMIVWGGDYWSGTTYTGLNTGGRYNPTGNTWSVTSTTDAAAARTDHNAVWTGNEMIVWGGNSNTGGRYNPAADNWFATTTNNAPSSRYRDCAVWIGNEMLVWGGIGSTYYNTGGRYCAQAPTPTPTPATPTPSPTASPTPTPSPTPSPSPTPLLPGITLVSRYSAAEASAQVGGSSDNPPAQTQTDFSPANLSNNAAASYPNGEGASSYSVSDSSISLDNSARTLQVNGTGFAHAEAHPPQAYAWARATDIVLSFTLEGSAYVYSLSGNLSWSSQAGFGTATGVAKLETPSSTIFDVSSPATLSQNGTLPPGRYTFSVIVYASHSESPYSHDSYGNFNFNIAPVATPTPSPGPSVTPLPTGTPSPTPVFIISGAVSYCSNPTAGPVPNVTLNLTSSGSSSTVSDDFGNYTFSSLSSGDSYAVTPSKVSLPSGATGINTVDVIAVQRHFLNLTLIPTGCRLTAADVNGDASITTVDVVAIQRFYLGLTTGIANVGKYHFNPATRTYPSLGGDQMNQNYDTLILGDVAPLFVSP